VADTNSVVLGESVVVSEFKDENLLVVSLDGDGIAPLWVSATVLADLTLDVVLAEMDDTVRVLFADDVFIMEKVGLDRSHRKSAGHL